MKAKAPRKEIAGTGSKKAPKRGPGRPRTRSTDEGRSLVVRAATRIFAERGFDAPLDAVARAAEVPRATLYELFETREALVLAVVRGAADLMFARLSAGFRAPDDASWREVVRGAYRATFRFVAEHPEVVMVLQLAERGGASSLGGASGMSGARQRVIADLAEQGRHRWELSGAHIGRSAGIIALMIYGMAESLAIGQIEKRRDPDALIDLLTEFTTGGLFAIWENELRALKRLDGKKK